MCIIFCRLSVLFRFVGLRFFACIDSGDVFGRYGIPTLPDKVSEADHGSGVRITVVRHKRFFCLRSRITPI